jgi:hypothetical protein
MPATAQRGMRRKATTVICQQKRKAIVSPTKRVAATSTKLEIV